MPEFIEREKALNDFDEWIETTGALPKGTSYYHECRACIEDVPAADVVEVVHGKWKLNKDGSGTCNQCHITQKNVWDYDNWQNYCGHCGAKMDGETNE